MSELDPLNHVLEVVEIDEGVTWVVGSADVAIGIAGEVSLEHVFCLANQITCVPDHASVDEEAEREESCKDTAAVICALPVAV